MKYTKKPVEIEAVQLNWANWNEICEFLGPIISPENPARNVDTCSDGCGESTPYIELTIPTLEGPMIARHGDYIIKGIHGEFYPCKPDIFEATYSESDEINVGDLYSDCRYHPIICTSNDGTDVIGISLVDNKECKCSIYHCVSKKLTGEEAVKLLEAHKKGGTAVLVLNGWTEEAADKFMKGWL